MRVLLINSNGADTTRGGAERYVGELATGLQARDVQVTVLSAFPVREDSSLPTRELHSSGWHDSRRRRYMNHAADWAAMPRHRFERILRAANPDLIHTNNLPGISTGIWESAHRLGYPVVHTLHDYHLLCPRTSLTKRDGTQCHPHPLLCGLRSRRMERWADDVRVVIGVSDSVLNRHDGFFPPTTVTRVIRPPVMPRVNQTPRPPGRRLQTVGFLGSLTQSKGVELLLEAAPMLTELGISLRIAGDGPLLDEVQGNPDVMYAGRLEGNEVGDFMATCDAGLVPSLWEEPGPLVIGEWLSAGRPVLGTRRGGIGEAVKRGDVIPFDSTAADLCEAVRRLTDEEVWRRAVKAVPVIDAEGDMDRWLDQHLDAYEIAISATPLAEPAAAPLPS
jgi:glycosyltransferase involved in cell wall biosynthesis